MLVVIYFCIYWLIYMLLSHNRPSRSGFGCPRCGCKVCCVPSDCPICQLTLISSSHLARSYHHLFPVSPFNLVTFTNENTSDHCFSCTKPFLNDNLNDHSKCEACCKIFCNNCDSYIHDHLHNCPGCLNKLI